MAKKVVKKGLASASKKTKTKQPGKAEKPKGVNAPSFLLIRDPKQYGMRRHAIGAMTAMWDRRLRTCV